MVFTFVLTLATTVSARWNSKACGVHEPDNGHITATVSWVLFGVSTLCITLRVLSRTMFLEGNLGWDDWLMILVWCIAVPSTVVIQLREYSRPKRPLNAI